MLLRYMCNVIMLMCIVILHVHCYITAGAMLLYRVQGYFTSCAMLWYGNT